MSDKVLKALFWILVLAGLAWFLFRPSPSPDSKNLSESQKTVKKNKWERVYEETGEEETDISTASAPLEPVIFTLWLRAQTILAHEDPVLFASRIASAGFQRVMIEAVQNDTEGTLTWHSKLLREHGHFYAPDLNLKNFLSALQDQKLEAFADLSVLAQIASADKSSALQPIKATDVETLVKEIHEEGYAGLAWEGATESLHSEAATILLREKMKYLPLNAVLPWHLETPGIHVSSERGLADLGLNSILIAYSQQRQSELWLRLQISDGDQDLPSFEWDHPGIFANLLRFRAIGMAPRGYVIAANPADDGWDYYGSLLRDLTQITVKARTQKKPIANLVLDLSKSQDNSQTAAWLLWEASAPFVNAALASGFELRVSLNVLPAAQAFLIMTPGMALDSTTGQFEPSQPRPVASTILRLIGQERPLLLMSFSPLPDSEDRSWIRIRRALGLEDKEFERIAQTSGDLPATISYQGSPLSWAKRDGVIEDSGDDSELVALTDIKPEDIAEDSETLTITEGKNELVLAVTRDNLTWINGNILDLDVWWLVSQKLTNAAASYPEPFDGWASAGPELCAFFARSSTKLSVKPPFPEGASVRILHFDAEGGLDEDESILTEGIFTRNMSEGDLVILEYLSPSRQ